ncbi:conserved oligomeric Golgi complex subunit 3 isoform X1 [Prionailurus iriomotensis]
MAEAALLLPPEAAAERDAREKLALWDRRPDTTAPLTDRQTDSVLELKAAVENLPVPAELPLEDLCSLTSQSLPAAEPSIVPESTEDILLKGFISLEMEEERIETAQQFFSWFAKLQTQMDQDEETKYRQMRDYLSGFQEQCDAILNDVNSALQHLESLQKQYLFVSNKTGTLHEACEQLLKEQPHFKDYPVYLLKFKQCLSKALHLMKTYTVNTLQNLTSQLLKRDPASVPNADNAFTLFYVKFRAAAPKVRTIIEQIEQRSEKIPEYQQLLNDIHQCYLDQRELLLGPSITCTVTELTSQNNRDHCALIRSGCAFMVHVCQDEHQLYNEFFTKPTSKLDELLEKLCVSLYDVFRPLIIHVIHLETLSELCGILKNEVLEDHVQNNAEQLGAFAAGVKQMLEDVQERLVYRTHIYIQTDITGYKPAPGDLAYPDKLVMMEQIAQSLKDEQKKVPSEASFSDVQLEETESNNLTKSALTGAVKLSSSWSPGQPRIGIVRVGTFQGSQLHPRSQVQGIIRTAWCSRSRTRCLGQCEGPLCEEADYQCLQKHRLYSLRRAGERRVGSETTLEEDCRRLREKPRYLALFCSSEGAASRHLPVDGLPGSTESLNPRPQTTISPADLHGIGQCSKDCPRKPCLPAFSHYLEHQSLSAKTRTQIDGQLFLIKHLLILREQIAPFHTEFTIKEISLDLKKTRAIYQSFTLSAERDKEAFFSQIRLDAAFKILNPMTVPRFFRLNSNNALIEFLLEGTPEIREHYLDSKKDVDRHLKSACEQFIQQQTKQFVEQLEEFMTKVSALKTMASQGGPKYTLSQQPWAQPAKVCELVASAYKTIKAKLPLTLRSMSLYLSNKDTEFILFKPVRNNIQQVFQKFHVLLKEDFSPEDTQIIACPSMEQAEPSTVRF